MKHLNERKGDGKKNLTELSIGNFAWLLRIDILDGLTMIFVVYINSNDSMLVLRILGPYDIVIILILVGDENISYWL